MDLFQKKKKAPVIMMDDEIMPVRGLALSVNEKEEIQMISFHKFNAFKVLD